MMLKDVMLYWKRHEGNGGSRLIRDKLEQKELSKSRLYVCFVDVKKACLSVRRELILRKFAEDGGSDSLIRMIWAI